VRHLSEGLRALGYASTVARYTYGDSELAADRLAIVAELFGPASETFLRSAVPSPPALAVDLGCGPGHTTRLVHGVTGAHRTVGLDRSPAFVATASTSRDATGISFLVHDATTLPLPVESPDLIYARLLLAHLPHHGSIVQRWCAAAARGGRVLLDEVEAVDTDDPLFRTYLDEVAIPVVTSQGGRLIVGPALHEMADPDAAFRVHDEVVTLRPPAALTARMFSMNLDVLADAGEIARRPDLSDGLAAFAADPSAPPVVWHMRQIAFERRSTG
jgi:trans-aconitate 2-methyltransferase